MVGSLVNTYGLGLVLECQDRMSKDLERAAKQFEKLKGKSDETAKKMKSDAEKMAEATAKIKNQFMTSLKLMGVGSAILAPFGIAANEAAAMEEGLADINTLLVAAGMNSEQSAKAQAGLKAAILDTTTKVKVPMRDLVKSTYDLISADLTVAEAQGVLPSSAKLAIAGMGSMEDAVQTMTSSMNTFGKTWGNTMTPVEKGEKIANIYVGTVAKLKTTLPELTSAMAYSAGMASQLGMALSETAVGIGMVQTAGIEGMRAGTSYNSFLRTLLQLLGGQRNYDPMLQGIALVDENTGRMKSVADILEQIEKKFGVTSGGLKETANSAKKSAALVNTFGEEGARAIMLLIGQSSKLREYSKAIEETNVLNEMVTARQASWNVQKALSKQLLSSLGVIIGDQLVPVLHTLNNAMKNLVGWALKFSAANPLITKFIVSMIALTGLTLILGGGLKLITVGFSALKTILGLTGLAATYASGGFAALAASVWATLWPILAVIAAVAGLIYLISKIPGVDFSIKDFLPGNMPPIAAPVDLGVLTAGKGGGNMPISSSEASGTAEGGSYDYSTHRNTYHINMEGVNDPESFNKELKNFNNKQKTRDSS